MAGSGENESESLREGGVASGRKIERKGGWRQRGREWEWEWAWERGAAEVQGLGFGLGL